MLHDPATMDLSSSVGFVTACYHATCLRPSGGLLAAPVCSSFVYVPLGSIIFDLVGCWSTAIGDQGCACRF